jgi:hypothetical protein
MRFFGLPSIAPLPVRGGSKNSPFHSKPLLGFLVQSFARRMPGLLISFFSSAGIGFSRRNLFLKL